VGLTDGLATLQPRFAACTVDLWSLSMLPSHADRKRSI